jgi:hypothetical protein
MSRENYIDMTFMKPAFHAQGDLLMESLLETKSDNNLEFVHGTRGSLALTFERETVREENRRGSESVVANSKSEQQWAESVHVGVRCRTAQNRIYS